MRHHIFDRRRQLPILRERAKLSQRALAEKVAEKIGRPVSQDLISRVELGQRQPSFEVAEGICVVLGVPVDDLVVPKPVAVG